MKTSVIDVPRKHTQDDLFGDELVQNGGDAMTIFPIIKDMDATSAEQARNALLAYCRLDTLAMVRIWEKLKEVVEKE